MIPRQLADFLEEGLGIHIGTRTQALHPNGARALAVRVDEDGTHLEVYVSAVAASRVLPDLRLNGQAAIDFGRPTDDRACQVKGIFVSDRAAEAGEQPFVLGQWVGFLEKLEGIGIPRAALEGWITWPAHAIRLKATALFGQTPGPQAGKALS